MKKTRPPSPPPPVSEKGPRSPATSQPQSPIDKPTKSSSELPPSGRDGKVKEEKRKAQAAQGKEKEKEKGVTPVSSLSSLPLPNLIDHIDGTDRSVLFVCVA